MEPAWVGHLTACSVILTRRGWEGSQEKNDIFNISRVAKMKLK